MTDVFLYPVAATPDVILSDPTLLRLVHTETIPIVETGGGGGGGPRRAGTRSDRSQIALPQWWTDERDPRRVAATSVGGVAVAARMQVVARAGPSSRPGALTIAGSVAVRASVRVRTANADCRVSGRTTATTVVNDDEELWLLIA